MSISQFPPAATGGGGGGGASTPTFTSETIVSGKVPNSGVALSGLAAGTYVVETVADGVKVDFQDNGSLTYGSTGSFYKKIDAEDNLNVVPSKIYGSVGAEFEWFTEIPTSNLGLDYQDPPNIPASRYGNLAKGAFADNGMALYMGQRDSNNAYHYISRRKRGQDFSNESFWASSGGGYGWFDVWSTENEVGVCYLDGSNIRVTAFRDPDNTNLDIQLLNEPYQVNAAPSVAKKGDTYVVMYASSDDISVSTDNGVSWTHYSNQASSNFVNYPSYDDVGGALMVVNGYFFAATTQFGRFMYSSDGVNWTDVNTSGSGFFNKIVWDGTRYLMTFGRSGSDIHVVTLDENFANEGTLTPDGTETIHDVVLHDGKIYAFSPYAGGSVRAYVSTDNGSTWFEITTSTYNNTYLGTNYDSVGGNYIAYHASRRFDSHVDPAFDQVVMFVGVSSVSSSYYITPFHFIDPDDYYIWGAPQGTIIENYVDDDYLILARKNTASGDMIVYDRTANKWKGVPARGNSSHRYIYGTAGAKTAVEGIWAPRDDNGDTAYFAFVGYSNNLYLRQLDLTTWSWSSSNLANIGTYSYSEGHWWGAQVHDLAVNNRPYISFRYNTSQQSSGVVYYDTASAAYDWSAEANGITGRQPIWAAYRYRDLADTDTYYGLIVRQGFITGASSNLSGYLINTDTNQWYGNDLTAIGATVNAYANDGTFAFYSDNQTPVGNYWSTNGGVSFNKSDNETRYEAAFIYDGYLYAKDQNDYVYRTATPLDSTTYEQIGRFATEATFGAYYFISKGLPADYDYSGTNGYGRTNLMEQGELSRDTYFALYKLTDEEIA